MFFVFSFVTTENKQILLEAKRMLKKSKRKDYYKILGVNKSASEEEIKKAYKKRALVHHPGKLSIEHNLICYKVNFPSRKAKMENGC